MVKKILKNTLKILLLIFVLLAIAFAVFYYMYADRLAMMQAVIQGDMDTVEVLIDNDVDINKTFFNIDLIHYYIVTHKDNYNIEFIKFLIDKGINLNIVNEKRVPAIVSGIIFSKPEIVKILIENGANPNIVLSNGVKPLGVAIQMQNCEIVNILIENGATLEGDKFIKDRIKQLEQCVSE